MVHKILLCIFLLLFSPSGGTLWYPYAEADKTSINLDSWMTVWKRDTAHLFVYPALVYGQKKNVYYIWAIIHFEIYLLKQLAYPNWQAVFPESLLNKAHYIIFPNPRL